LNSSEDIGGGIESEIGNKTISGHDELNKTISGNDTLNKGLETKQKKSKSIPGFEIYCGVACLVGVFLYKRK
jgi:hypothetical protein